VAHDKTRHANQSSFRQKAAQHPANFTYFTIRDMPNGVKDSDGKSHLQYKQLQNCCDLLSSLNNATIYIWPSDVIALNRIENTVPFELVFTSIFALFLSAI